MACSHADLVLNPLPPHTRDEQAEDNDKGNCPYGERCGWVLFKVFFHTPSIPPLPRPVAVDKEDSIQSKQ